MYLSGDTMAILNSIVSNGMLIKGAIHKHFSIFFVYNASFVVFQTFDEYISSLLQCKIDKTNRTKN